MGYMKEFGRAGQKRTGGIFYEEFLPELQGKKGIETYREMADNDDVVGAILFAVDMLIRGCSWDTQPGGNTPADEEAADFVWQCMNDMTETWIDTISEILSMLTYGWSAHEIVYKRRMGRKKDIRLNSKYNDGRIGWQKLPIRSQETLYRWEYDDNDNLLGLTQMPPPKFDLITIPANKLLLFRTKSSKGNPEGRSILRNSYRSWYFKKRIQEIEGIGIERDLAGLPVMTAPEGVDIWDNDDKNMVSARREAERYVKSIRRDSLEGVVKPEGWKLELLTSGGKRNKIEPNKTIRAAEAAARGKEYKRYDKGNLCLLPGLLPPPAFGRLHPVLGAQRSARPEIRRLHHLRRPRGQELQRRQIRLVSGPLPVDVFRTDEPLRQKSRLGGGRGDRQGLFGKVLHRHGRAHVLYRHTGRPSAAQAPLYVLRELLRRLDGRIRRRDRRRGSAAQGRGML